MLCNLVKAFTIFPSYRIIVENMIIHRILYTTGYFRGANPLSNYPLFFIIDLQPPSQKKKKNNFIGE